MAQITVFNTPISVVMRWQEIKAIAAYKNLNLQYVDQDTHYVVFLVDGPIGYRATIVKTSFVSDEAWSYLWDAAYTPIDHLIDVDDFEVSHKATANLPLQQAVEIWANKKAIPTSEGMLSVATSKPAGLEGVNVFSYNWCDPTTWYQNAVWVSDEIPQDSGDHKTFALAHGNVIDTSHGKITQEDQLVDASSRSYKFLAKISEVPSTEVDPHDGAGDYTVDYKNGVVVFGTALSASDAQALRFSYHYATDSVYTLKPNAGTKLYVNLAEIQISDDFDMRDTILYRVFGLVDVFAPELSTTNGGPIPAGTKIPLKTFTYKTLDDFVNDSMRAYPTYPAIGDPANWRSIKRPKIVFDWDYLKGKTLDSAAGIELRCSLQHDVPCGGSSAVVTFYCDY